MTDQPLQVHFKRSAFRAALIKPEQVVVIPGYFLRWLPYLGAQRAWFVIAMRQAYFFTYHCRPEKSTSVTAPFQVSRKQLAAWSGLGANKVWELTKSLEAPEQAGHYLAWFLQAESYGQGIQKRYTFRIDMPLTPGDARALQDWLLAAGARSDPLKAVEQALQAEPRELYPFPPPAPTAQDEAQIPNPQTVQQVVFAATGVPADPHIHHQLSALADRLAAKLLRPDDQIVITHYFLREWVKKLGALPAWIITVLRDKGYVDHHAGVVRDRITLAHGYRELASLLSVTERTIRDWVPPLERMSHPGDASLATPRQKFWAQRQRKRALIGAFLDKDGHIDRASGVTRYTFTVRMDEPLTPEHQPLHAALLDLQHELVTHPAPEARGTLVREINNLFQPAPRAASSSLREINNPGTRNKQEAPGSVREINKVATRFKQLKALLKPLKKQALSEIQQLLLAAADPPENQAPTEALPTPAVGVGPAATPPEGFPQAQTPDRTGSLEAGAWPAEAGGRPGEPDPSAHSQSPPAPAAQTAPRKSSMAIQPTLAGPPASLQEQMTPKESRAEDRSVPVENPTAPRPAAHRNPENGPQPKTAQDPSPEQPSPPGRPPHEEPAPSGTPWDFDRLLQAEGVAARVRRRTLRTLRQNPDLGTRLLAWLIYGYEQHKSEGGVAAPGFFALSRYETGRPKSRYLALARLTPQDLADRLRTRFSPQLTAAQKQLLSDLEAHGFGEILADQCQGLRPEPLPSAAQPATEQACPAPVAPDAEEATQTPRSADGFWAEICQLLGADHALQPSALWLNDQELAVSFLDPQAYRRAQAALQARQQPIRSRYPDACFRLRRLELEDGKARAVPTLVIAEETVI